MEKWDAYDKDFNKIGNLDLKRGDFISDGVFHLVCDIAVKHIDGSYLLMQRSNNKHFGGMWELTAGGSAIQGESPLECAIRELKEETGIKTKELKEIGRVVSYETHSIYFEFLCLTNIDKNSIILQEGETQDFKWVNKEELIKMNSNNLITKRMQLFLEDFCK
jgi:8-oxo-dGTP pyrophosphatase MutT (NUDIX family)